jgi:hypothetical protein
MGVRPAVDKELFKKPLCKDEIQEGKSLSVICARPWLELEFRSLSAVSGAPFPQGRRDLQAGRDQTSQSS